MKLFKKISFFFCQIIENVVVSITKGEATSTGEYKGALKEGDILVVPVGHQHGLVGAGEDGFSGITIHFVSKGTFSLKFFSRFLSFSHVFLSFPSFHR